MCCGAGSSSRPGLQWTWGGCVSSGIPANADATPVPTEREGGHMEVQGALPLDLLGYERTVPP